MGAEHLINTRAYGPKLGTKMQHAPRGTKERLIVFQAGLTKSL